MLKMMLEQSTQLPQKQRKHISQFNVQILKSTGNFESVTYDKTTLKNITQLNTRDIRLHLPNEPIGYFVHNNCQILNVPQLKMIIMWDCLIIFDWPNVDQHLHKIQSQLKQKKNTPFEFIVLEFILRIVNEMAEQQYSALQEQINTVLDSLLDFPTQAKSLELLPLKHEFKKFEVSVKSIHDTFSCILNNDDDLIKMYLTSKHFNKHIESPEYVEDLLESYYCKLDHILDGINILNNKISETDDTVEMVLNINRNRIMKTDVWNNFLNLALNFGTFVTVHFATNLEFPGGGYSSFTNGWIIIFCLSWISIIIPTIIFACIFKRHKL